MCVRAILAAGSGQTISADTLSGLQFGSCFILKLCWRQFLSHNAFVKPLQTLKSTFMSDFFCVTIRKRGENVFYHNIYSSPFFMVWSPTMRFAFTHVHTHTLLSLSLSLPMSCCYRDPNKIVKPTEMFFLALVWVTRATDRTHIPLAAEQGTIASVMFFSS